MLRPSTHGFPFCGVIGLVLWLLSAVATDAFAQADPTDVDESDLEEFSVPLDPAPVNTEDEKEAPARLIMVHRERARWPRVAAKKNLSGCAVYAFSVDPSGAVTMVFVVDSSNEHFTEPGRDALYRYIFEPLKAVGDEAEGGEDVDGPDASDGGGNTAEGDEAEERAVPTVYRIQLVWKLRNTPLPNHPACQI